MTARSLLSGAALALALPVAWAQAVAPASALQLRSWAAACSNCHGTGGVPQPGMEPLAGVAKEELARKLLDFKAGRRPATIMHQLAKGYSDEQLEQLASYFAALKK